MTTHPNLPADRHLHRPGRTSLFATLLATTTLFTACASSVPAPNQQVLASEAAVTSATSAGAADLAPTELRTARDKLAQAKAAVAAEHNEHATRLAREAQVDANLAEAKARNTQAQKAAGELGEGNRVLREELQRATQ